jgi:hypothetical protein
VTPLYQPGDRGRALRAFFAAAILFGLGAAAIDQAKPGLPQYYFGWMFVVTGVLLLFSSAERAVFRPVWVFALAFLIEVFGWWNVFWMIVDLRTCWGCNFDQGVILANLGQALPYNHGILYMPLWTFLVTTLIAIAVPILIARTGNDGVVARSYVVPY